MTQNSQSPIRDNSAVIWIGNNRVWCGWVRKCLGEYIKVRTELRVEVEVVGI